MDELKPTEQPTIEESVYDAEIDADLKTVDPGPVPQTAEEQQLYRLVRIGQRYTVEADRVEDQSKAMVKGLRAKADRFFYRYNALLQELVKGILGDALQRGQKKSVKTSFGTAGFRRRGGNVVVKDIAEFEKLFEVTIQGDGVAYVRVKVEPNLKAINDHYKATGELLPGCDLEPVQDRFYVD